MRYVVPTVACRTGQLRTSDTLQWNGFSFRAELIEAHTQFRDDLRYLPGFAKIAFHPLPTHRMERPLL